jgi:indole-3-glycerol phosphate synthase
MTILDKIIENKKREINRLIKSVTVRDLERSSLFERKVVSLSGSIIDKSKTGIIAEFKRKSPSKGIINSFSTVEEVTSGYCDGGASGLSILTDSQFFGGSNEDLTSARRKSTLPILRKDFIIDEYQVIESKSIGADAILLIAAALNNSEILKLSRLARSLGMEVLLEIHEESELEKINQYINIIGVNNRNLKTFEVNTVKSELLAEKISSAFIKISESGISSSQMIRKLKAAGYDGFLIGEKFMSTSDPVKAFFDFVKDLN